MMPVSLQACIMPVLACLAPLTVSAAQVQLLGFVSGICPTEQRCFVLQVEKPFSEKTGARLTVRYGAGTIIRDPEGYRVTLANAGIVPGAHLSLTLEGPTPHRPAAGGAPSYQATDIWVGD